MAPSFTDLLSYLFHFVARAKLEAFLVEGTTFLVEHIHLAKHFRKKNICSCEIKILHG